MSVYFSLKTLFQIHLISLSLPKMRARGAMYYQKKDKSSANIIKLYSACHNELFMALCGKEYLYVWMTAENRLKLQTGLGVIRLKMSQF